MCAVLYHWWNPISADRGASTFFFSGLLTLNNLSTRVLSIPMKFDFAAAGAGALLNCCIMSV